MIEQLTEKNLIKDFFEELAGGRPRGDLEGRAARLGCDLDQPHVVLVAEPWSEALARALRVAAPGSLFDHREDSLRALVRLDRGDERVVRRAAPADPRRARRAGRRSACRASARARRRSRTASPRRSRRSSAPSCSPASRPSSPTTTSARTSTSSASRSTVALRDATVDAVGKLAEYDAQRGAQLLATLEEFLRRHGSISATSEALYVHPNTLRQRLRRIGELSGLDLRRDDWLAIEIAVKMVKLQQALGASKTG